MEVMKVLIIITITMALSITLTMKGFGGEMAQEEKPAETATPVGDATVLPSRSLSRFLKEEAERNPRSASHCRKNKKMCEKMHGKGWQCCNNKCVDLMNDKHNCGGCKKKCKYTSECCRGQCVDVAYDKRHCGQCNRRCQRGKFCVYGMCEYA